MSRVTSTRSPFRCRVGLAAGLSAQWIAAKPVVACAVCFGDPNSAMAKGVVAGVVVLASVIGFVLFGVAGTGLYWVHRSRRLSGLDPSKGLSPEVGKEVHS